MSSTDKILNISKETFFGSGYLKKIIPQKDTYATVALMFFLLVIGIILTRKFYSIKNTANLPANDSSLMIINILYYMSIILILLPIILLFLNITGLYSELKFVQPFETVVRAQVILLIYAILMLLLTYYLQSSLKNNGQDKLLDDKWLWGTQISFIIGMLIFVFIRYMADRERKNYVYNTFKTAGKSIFNNLPTVAEATFPAVQLAAAGVATAASGLYNKAKSLYTGETFNFDWNKQFDNWQETTGYKSSLDLNVDQLLNTENPIV